MLDLQPLYHQIAREGSDSDLYRGVRRLDRHLPVSLDVSEAYMRLAAAITRLYPARIATIINNAYDARIVCMEFCDHPATTRNDILMVLTDGANAR